MLPEETRLFLMPVCSSIQHISSSSTLMSVYECSGGIMQMREKEKKEKKKKREKN